MSKSPLDVIKICQTVVQLIISARDRSSFLGDGGLKRLRTSVDHLKGQIEPLGLLPAMVARGQRFQNNQPLVDLLLKAASLQGQSYAAVVQLQVLETTVLLLCYRGQRLQRLGLAASAAEELSMVLLSIIAAAEKGNLPDGSRKTPFHEWMDLSTLELIIAGMTQQESLRHHGLSKDVLMKFAENIRHAEPRAIRASVALLDGARAAMEFFAMALRGEKLTEEQLSTGERSVMVLESLLTATTGLPDAARRIAEALRDLGEHNIARTVTNLAE